MAQTTATFDVTLLLQNLVMPRELLAEILDWHNKQQTGQMVLDWKDGKILHVRISTDTRYDEHGKPIQ